VLLAHRAVLAVADDRKLVVGDATFAATATSISSRFLFICNVPPLRFIPVSARQSYPVRTGFFYAPRLTTLWLKGSEMPEWSGVGGMVEHAGGIRRRPPGLVLSLRFGGLLVFIVAAATGTLVVLDRVRHQETLIRQAFLQRLGALDQIRAQIYLSGTYVRDFLLSPTPPAHKRRPSVWPLWSARLTPLFRATGGYWRPRNANPSRPCRMKSRPTGAFSTAPWHGLRSNATASDTPSSTTSWSRAAPPCCRLRTASPQ